MLMTGGWLTANCFDHITHRFQQIGDQIIWGCAFEELEPHSVKLLAATLIPSLRNTQTALRVCGGSWCILLVVHIGTQEGVFLMIFRENRSFLGQSIPISVWNWDNAKHVAHTGQRTWQNCIACLQPGGVKLCKDIRTQNPGPMLPPVPLFGHSQSPLRWVSCRTCVCT